MPNNRIGKSNVERHTVSFEPAQWTAFVDLYKSLKLKAVTELFRALYIMYVENKDLLHPLLLKTLEENKGIRAKKSPQFDSGGIGALLKNLDKQ